MNDNLSPCPGLQILIDQGLIKVRGENIDKKGMVTVVELNSYTIKYCPCCGEKICSVEMLPGKCDNLEICSRCGNPTKDGPDGPWCPKCEPDAPAKFHVMESEGHNNYPENYPVDY